MTAPICPSIDFDIDFDDDDSGSAQEHASRVEEAFLAALSGAPALAEKYSPVVTLISDEEAVYLRGTVWISAYDEQAARAVAEHVVGWAATNGLDCQVRY